MSSSQKRRTALLIVLTLLWTTFIFQRSLQPAEISHDESTAVLNPLLHLFPWLSLYLIRKLAHFTEYFILGLLAWSSANRLLPQMIWISALYCFAVACMDEGIQRFVPGRSGEIKDVLLDLSGSFFALAICSLAGRLQKKRKHGGVCHGRTGKKDPNA